MAIKNIIAKGVGFSPGDTSFIPTHGFSIGAAPVGGDSPIAIYAHVCGGFLFLFSLIGVWRVLP